MIPIGSISGQLEVNLDLPADRVALVVLSTGWIVWLTDAEADRLGESAQLAARELRRSRKG